MSESFTQAERDSNFNAAYEIPYDERGYPRAGEYWYDPEPYGPGSAGGYPCLVEQVGVTTIWLQSASGARFHLNFAEMRSKWQRTTKPVPVMRPDMWCTD